MLIGEFGIGHVDTHPKTATIIAAGHYYRGKATSDCDEIPHTFYSR